MIFEQRRLARFTQLALRENGLYVCQRDGWGHIQLEIELPYEQVLPLQTEQCRTPARQLPRPLQIGLIVAGYIVIGLLARHLSTWQLGVLTAGLGALVLAGLLYARRNWQRRTVLNTPHLRVLLADRPADRAGLARFIAALETRSKSYLRGEYGSINPLGFIEPQLRRLRWLRELEVLSQPEAQALTTRLTGRLSASTLRSMGQELEAPYVN